MSCWFGFPPTSLWADDGLSALARIAGNNDPIPKSCCAAHVIDFVDHHKIEAVAIVEER